MGKALEKQIKTIEDQGKKQVKALEDLKPKEQIKAVNDKSDTTPPISKEIYNEILGERIDEILKMSREINYSNLVYDFKGPTPSINFSIFGGPMYTYNQLKNGEKNITTSRRRAKTFLKRFKPNNIRKSKA